MLNMNIIPKITNRQARQTKATKFHFFVNLGRFRMPVHREGGAMTNVSDPRTVVTAESSPSTPEAGRGPFLSFPPCVGTGTRRSSIPSPGTTTHTGSSGSQGPGGNTGPEEGQSTRRCSGISGFLDVNSCVTRFSPPRAGRRSLESDRGALVPAPHPQVVPAVSGKRGLPTC